MTGRFEAVYTISSRDGKGRTVIIHTMKSAAENDGFQIVFCGVIFLDSLSVQYRIRYRSE